MKSKLIFVLICITFASSGRAKSTLDSILKRLDKLEAENEALTAKVQTLEARDYSTIAFSAAKYQDDAEGPVIRFDGDITYNDLILDTTNAFDKESGVFTAPQDGVYFMFFSGQNYGKDITKVGIYKNEEEDFIIYEEGDGDDGDNLAYSWTMALAMGDQVKLKVVQNKLYVSQIKHITFSGFLWGILQ